MGNTLANSFLMKTQDWLYNLERKVAQIKMNHATKIREARFETKKCKDDLGILRNNNFAYKEVVRTNEQAAQRRIKQLESKVGFL